MKIEVSRIFITAAIFLIAGSFPLGAQASSSPNELTIEQLFLKSVQAQVLREKAFTEDYSVKMSVLDDIDRMFKDNSIGDDNRAQIEFILEYLSLEGTGRMVREAKRQVNYFPDVRQKAVNLLGRLGGPDANRAIITVLLGDIEPVVKAEAAYALGTIGLNDNNATAEALSLAIDRENPAKPDNNFAFAVCLAFEKLSQKFPDAGGPVAFRALVKIAQGSYKRETRAKALQVLDTIGKLQSSKK